jgi:hypothetical protein
VSTLPRASLLHSGRPTVVTVGAGARALRKTTLAPERHEPSVEALRP